MPRPLVRDLLLLGAVVALVRAPFLDRPVQGDDVYYLLFAENVLADPLHPLQMGFRLQGETVWAAGHTRPPGNAYTLAALLAIFGEVREVPFHLAYALFSLVAAVGVYALARRSTGRPLTAALIFVAAPSFVVNGSKLESDLPMLALLAAGAALFVHARYLGAGAALAGACFFGYQAVFVLPVLAWRDRSRAALAALAAGPALLVAWQLGERMTAGAAPVESLAAYVGPYGLLELGRKLRSAQALQSHLGLMVSPLLAGPWLFRRAPRELAAGLAMGALQAVWLDGYTLNERALFALAAGLGLAVVFHAARLAATARDRDERFLGVWAAGFFAVSLALFYAGSARYLLPLAPALALLVARAAPSRAALAAGVASHLALGLALTASEARTDAAYRDIAREVRPLAGDARHWSNAEWGLRYYLGVLGGEPLLKDQTVPENALVVESALAAPIPYRTEGVRQLLLERTADTGPYRLRTIGPGSRSGYSSSEFGVLPFGLGGGEVDRIRAYRIGRAEAALSSLRMNDPAAAAQLLAGFYPSDGGAGRWMGPEAAALLRVPEAGASAFEWEFHIPENAPARRVEVELDGRPLVQREFAETGGIRVEAPVEAAPGATVRVVLRASPSFTPPGDARDLSVVVLGFGLR